ncbi:hypothetical protein KDK95_05425 [Actinospica sp. MGRD01-02]|uniref:Uncharacterized protein n=1 Tax=Actinospica acidithermotolerans TaxID=2828514 RepID=A0A941EDC5_9ACTN|nr:hypothetical protein [Actinospica acidithermotolerans]MBR7825739.1 hypothetical protein [Actinospica acidithermotolerans]
MTIEDAVGPGPGAAADRRSRRAARGQGSQQALRVKPDVAPPVQAKVAKPAKPQKPPREPKQPKPATKVRRQEDPPAEADRQAYAPVKPGRTLGYVLWQVLRFTVRVVFKLVRLMIKIALSPFHAAG